MHVKMRRIESGVTVPKGFILSMNVEIVTAKIFCPPLYTPKKIKNLTLTVRDFNKRIVLLYNILTFVGVQTNHY
jgi:hypothetical protein